MERTDVTASGEILHPDASLVEQRREATHPGRTHPRRLMTFDELAGVAAFLASDRASGLTGTIVNLTMGALDD